MERHKRTLIVMAIAVVTATLATWTVYGALGRIPAGQVEVARLQVVVAARAIPIGTAITHGDVKLVDWPATSPLAGSFSSPDAAVGRGVVVGVSENEPITEARLAPREAGAGLPPAIGRGMRAISV